MLEIIRQERAKEGIPDPDDYQIVRTFRDAPRMEGAERHVAMGWQRSRDQMIAEAVPEIRGIVIPHDEDPLAVGKRGEAALPG